MDYASLARELGVQGFVQGREYRAHCPLHDDSNPSFSLNIENGLWICHSGCGQGEFIRLIELVLNCSPQEAYDWARANGRATSVEQLSKNLAAAIGEPLPTQYKEVPRGWLDYYEFLSSKAMPLWFLKRGFTWNTINEWYIRYDNINDAVVIPVVWKDELVGTVTRNTRPGLPKYQNSSNLPRSEILFGEISKGKNEIIICEGILDALWAWQNGLHAVSLLGNHISQQQVNILKEYRFGNITLALDNDEAGQLGTQEALRKLSDAGWLLPQIKMIRFPDNIKDMQDCYPELLAELYASRKEVIYGLIST